MSYATTQDIVDLHGQHQLDLLADRDDDGTVDTSAVESALEAASGEIDSRIGVRYPTPLTTIPDVVKIATVEIACYRLANKGTSLTDDIRKRYEDMVSWLKDVAAGKANLGIPALDDGAEQGDADFRAPVGMWGLSQRV